MDERGSRLKIWDLRFKFMKITKLGHCCLIIEESGVKILTDPGEWTEAQNTEVGIDYILITHEHPDHFSTGSVKRILQNNPTVQIYSNSSVCKLLDAEGVKCQVVIEGDKLGLKGMELEAFGKMHGEIYGEVGMVENVGFLLGGKLFFPGDAFTFIENSVSALALPVCGPWVLLKEAIDYALKQKPKVAFPVHDGMLKISGTFHGLPKKILMEKGIDFKIIEAGGFIEI
jgi:L-ascorbate metabolism protein UlaG (beta-lactamase superfamily)